MPQIENQARSLFIPITKVDEEKRIVYGTLTAEQADMAGEILDYDTAKDAIQKWSDDQAEASGGKSLGNIREMHGNTAAGKLVDLVFDDAGKRVEGAAKVIDDGSWNKVIEGVLTGFSIGGGYAKIWRDPDNANLKRYTPRLTEISLVDKPCVSDATFEFIKADGSTELRKFHTPQENPIMPGIESENDDLKPVQVWLAKDGSTHKSKKDALQKNAEIATKPLADEAAAALAKLGDQVAVQEGAAPAVAAATEEPMIKVEGTDEGTVVANEQTAAAAAIEAAPAPVEKAAPAPLKKGLYEVSRFADLIQSLVWLQSCVEFEAECEKDGSMVPADIKAACMSLCEALKAMVNEETAELFPVATEVEVLAMCAKGAPVEALAKFVRDDAELMKRDGAEDFVAKLEKAGATHSKATKGHLTLMSDHLDKMADNMDGMKKCMKGLGMDDGDEDGDGAANKLAKFATENETMMAENAELKKSLGNITSTVGALTERLAKVEAQPAAGGAVTRVVQRDHEGQGAGAAPAEGLQKLINSTSSPAECAAAMMKMTLANPQPI